MSKYAVWLLPVILVACVDAAPITTAPVSVVFNSAQAKSGNQGFEPTDVRVYKRDADRKSEIKGVTCKVQGSGYTANVVTPGIVNLPDYGSKSQPITLTCKYEGNSLSESFAAFSRTSQTQTNSGASGGLLGVLVVSVIESGRDKANDDWGYPLLSVTYK